MPFFFAPREARTTLPCPDCGAALDIRRTCHEAYMHCPACKKSFELSPFISRMDDAMENFLEHLYVDRVCRDIIAVSRRGTERYVSFALPIPRTAHDHGLPASSRGRHDPSQEEECPLPFLT